MRRKLLQLAQEIVDELEAAIGEFAAVAESLGSGRSSTKNEIA